MASIPGGWTAHIAANRALAIEARALLNEALGLDPIAPESMVGSMAAIARPRALDEDAADALTTALAEEDRIEVPVGAFPVRAAREPGAPPNHALLRLSAQRYNELADFERLAEVLVGRGLGRAGAAAGARSGASGASAIVAG